MKKLLILEGIASAGKTTVVNLLKQELGGRYSVRVFTEEETLMDIVEDRSFETAILKLLELLDSFRSASEQVIITDRYHFTHLFRTNKSFKNIETVETALIKELNAYIFLLTVEENQIASRVSDSWNRRGTWLGKTGTLDEKVAYYIDQQKQMQELAAISRIPVIEIDTTRMDWRSVVTDILAKSLLSNSHGK